MSSIACAVARAPALVEPERRPDVAADRGTRRPRRRAGRVTTSRSPGLGAAAARDALAAAERGDAQHDRGGRGRVAADDRHAGLGDPLVELEDVLDAVSRGHGEGDDERLRHRRPTRRGR